MESADRVELSDEVRDAGIETDKLLPYSENAPLRAGVDDEEDEGVSLSLRSILFEVLPALTAAGIGLVLAGSILDYVQHWPVYEEVTELFILVPVLLGLKGNVDMPLASRLSTAMHTGKMSSFAVARPLFVANLALVEVQTVAVGALAAGIAVLLGVLLHHEFSAYHAVLLLSSSIVTAGVTGLVFGLFTCLLVFVSARLRFDPDNTAGPLVASLGDLFTLFLLSVSADACQALHNAGWFWVAPAVAACFVLPLPLWVAAVQEHAPSAPVLRSGWTPIISAMAIGNVSGMFLERSVATFQGLAVLVPFLNGVGGNMGAIYSSRLCSALHSQRVEHRTRSTFALTLLNVPIQAVFLVIVFHFGLGHVNVTPQFVFAYITASTLQVMVVLAFVGWLVPWLWRKGVDPDNYASPLLAAFADVLGTMLLVLVFSLLYGAKGSALPAAPAALRGVRRKPRPSKHKPGR